MVKTKAKPPSLQFVASSTRRLFFAPPLPAEVHANAETTQSQITERDILEETDRLREDAEQFGLDVRIVTPGCEMNVEKKTATEANDIMLVRGSVSSAALSYASWAR